MDNLSPDQQRQIMLEAQMEANQSLRQALMEKMTKSCFEKCAGTSVSSILLQTNRVLRTSIIITRIESHLNALPLIF